MNIAELVKKSGLWNTIGNPKELEVFAALVRSEALEEAAGWVEKLGALNTATHQNIAAAIRGLK